MRPKYQKLYDYIEKNEPVTTARIVRDTETTFDRTDKLLNNMLRVGTLQAEYCVIRTVDGDKIDEAVAWETS